MLQLDWLGLWASIPNLLVATVGWIGHQTYATSALMNPSCLFSAHLVHVSNYQVPLLICRVYTYVICTPGVALNDYRQLNEYMFDQETLHNHRDNVKERHNSFDSLEASLHGCDLKSSLDETEGKKWDSNRSLLTNWPLISSIIVYCAFSLHDMAYTEIFSLWAVSNRKYGGLSFSSQQVGNVLAITGFSLLLFQTFLYPPIEKILGPIALIRIGGILAVPLLSSYPLIAMVSGFTLTLLISCASVLKNILSVTIVTGFFLLQNNSVPQHQRGAANGISMTAMSLFKAIGPAGGGAVFAWAQKRQVASFLPGDQMVFFMLNLVELIGVLLTFKPFLTTPDD